MNVLKVMKLMKVIFCNHKKAINISPPRLYSPLVTLLKDEQANIKHANAPNDG